MKTFNNLRFRVYPNSPSGTHALIFFKNGYGASIICGAMFYSDGKDTYEIAVLKRTRNNWNICYDTKIASDVIGYQTKIEISKILKQIQNL